MAKSSIYLCNARNIMQSIFTFFTSLGKVFSGPHLSIVDPNLVRYYRTEYGSRWEEELNHYLYTKNQKERNQSMIKAIITWLRNFSIYETKEQMIENYLSKSVDHADLDYRMRQLDRASFNGKNHSFLYRHLYQKISRKKVSHSRRLDGLLRYVCMIVPLVI